MLLVAACSTASGAASDTADGSGGEIQATNWVLRSYDVAGGLTIVPDDLYADADFRSQRVKGFAGCNTYDAVYWANGRQLLVSMAATTLMACADPAGSFETAYLALLDQSRYFNIRLDTLTIRGGRWHDPSRLRCRPEQPPARVVGRRLVCVRAGRASRPRSRERS